MTAWQGQLVEDFLKCSGIDRDRVVQIQGSHIDQANAILEWGKTISALKHHAYLIVGCKSHFLSQTTRSLAAEFGESGIRFNAIAPSLTDTPLADKLLNTPEKRENSNKRHPIGRIGTAHDIAALSAFLLSDTGSWITGQVLHADGGMGSLKLLA